MTSVSRFNLVDEPWIPVVDAVRVSLRQLFSHPEYRALGGNPVQIGERLTVSAPGSAFHLFDTSGQAMRRLKPGNMASSKKI